MHLGENNLVNRSVLSLLLKILHYLQVICQWFAGVVLAWSNWLPRRVWQSALHPARIDNVQH